jgi:hypothetical protein
MSPALVLAASPDGTFTLSEKSDRYSGVTMLTSTNEKVISLLASLGFHDMLRDPDGIVIDTFDEWTNPDAGVAYATCASGATVERWTEVAA